MERRKAGRVLRRDDQVRALLARYLLRRELAERLDRSARSLRFGTGARGKPRLLSGELEFNLSHSGSFLALAISADEVGIDIERRRQFEDAEQLLKDHFTGDEICWFRRHPRAGRSAAFLTLWTRKEALYKAMGEGLFLPLNHVSAHPELRSSAGWRIRTLQAPAGYLSALAWRAASSAR